MKRGLLSTILVSVPLLAGVATAAPKDRPRPQRLSQKAKPGSYVKPAANVVDSHILFLNRCEGGCVVKQSNTIDSTRNQSDIGGGTLTAFSYGDAKWNQVVTCMRNTMAPFNLQVTDIDPGNVPHFEVMIAGSPEQIGLPAPNQNGAIGGIADLGCSDFGVCDPFIPNALVFDFSDVWQGDVIELCGTAAQEIAHTWQGLDHVLDPTSPMTYNLGTTQQQRYKNNMTCGSDCQPDGSGKLLSPFGEQCVGTNPTSATHTCTSSGTNKQNEEELILAVFGPNNAKPVTAKITSPSDGAGVAAGFQIVAECNSEDPIQEAALIIDGNNRGRLTAAPFTFDSPNTLTDGSHTITVTCITTTQSSSDATVHISQGIVCQGDGDCPNATDICSNHQCVAGPGAQGGLGSPCTGNQDCASSSCGDDGTNKFCVVACDPANSACPGGFDCLDAGNNSGVCWPNGDSGGGGGCNTSGGRGPTGPLLLGLGFAAMLLGAQRRRSA